MSKTIENYQIVGIDIGSGSIKSIIGDVEPNGIINVVGFGKSSSKTGIKKGNVIDIAQTVKAIKEAVDVASSMAAADVLKVIITISGDHIKSVNSKGVVAVNELEITQHDVEKALQKCKDSFLSQNKEIIHIIPQEYAVDDQRGIPNPIGMTGNSLEVQVHVALANSASTKNIINCVNQNQLEVLSMVFAPIASAYGVLTQDEKELGVMLIDIGYATSTISVYKEGSILFSHIIPVGGYNITNDLALSLQIPIDVAEKLKVQYGFAMAGDNNPNQTIEVNKGNNVSIQTISEIIQYRVKEIFEFIKDDVIKAGVYNLTASGIVLTGGSANLNGIQTLAEDFFKKNVRVGFPHQNIRGLTDPIKHPEYAASVGLLYYARDNNVGMEQETGKEGFMGKIKDFIKKIL